MHACQNLHSGCCSNTVLYVGTSIFVIDILFYPGYFNFLVFLLLIVFDFIFAYNLEYQPLQTKNGLDIILLT